MTAADVRSALTDLCLLAEDVIPLDRDTHGIALDIVERYHLSFYDSLMLAAGCEVLLTEDMQPGLTIDSGPQVVNPFI